MQSTLYPIRPYQGVSERVDSELKGVRVRESSYSSNDISIIDFNYDSKYLVEIRNFDWSTTRQDIVNSLKVHILNEMNGIHFFGFENRQTGRAFIQLNNIRDYFHVFGMTPMNGRTVNGEFQINF